METQHTLIHNLHIDVLRCIFDYAVDYRENCNLLSVNPPIISAFIVSQVCRRWRSIALDAPRIWSYIGIDLSKHQDLINKCWDILLARAKSVPLVVHILFPPSSTYQSLPQHFKRMQAIEELIFEFKINEDVFTVLFDDSFPIPQCPIHKFNLNVCHSKQNGETALNLSILLSKWPPMSRIRLYGIRSYVNFDPRFPLPKTTHLDIRGIARLSLNTINTAFPALRYLDFNETHVAPSIEIFKTLTHLTRRRPVDMISSHLKFPNLTSLKIEDGIPEKHIFDFISFHKTIRILKVPHRFSLVDIAVSAPQLQTLSIAGGDYVHILYDWESAGLSSLPFPELQSLTIGVHMNLRLKEFESLVRSRFLSAKDRQSLPLLDNQRRIRSLILEYSISTSSTALLVPEWKCSPLLQYAKITDHVRRAEWHESWETTLEWPDVPDS